MWILNGMWWLCLRNVYMREKKILPIYRDRGYSHGNENKLISIPQLSTSPQSTSTTFTSSSTSSSSSSSSTTSSTSSTYSTSPLLPHHNGSIKKGIKENNYNGNNNKINNIIPKTDNQRIYIEKMQDDEKKAIVITGPAGTGKTLLACHTFIQEYRCGKYKNLILTRPSVPVEGETIGYLPGNVHQKMEPWTQPIFHYLQDLVGKNYMTNLIKSGIITVVPLAYMRGRTFHHTFVLADEMQNATPRQMKMLLTRMGEESKLIITGDISQSDNENQEINGLQDIIQRGQKYPFLDMSFLHLTEDDVVRSTFVQHVLSLYQDDK